jgi:hypothetical protein
MTASKLQKCYWIQLIYLVFCFISYFSLSFYASSLSIESSGGDWSEKTKFDFFSSGIFTYLLLFNHFLILGISFWLQKWNWWTKFLSFYYLLIIILLISLFINKNSLSLMMIFGFLSLGFIPILAIIHIFYLRIRFKKLK